MIILYPDKENEYINEIKKSKSLRNTIEKKINNINDDILIEILYQKYIFGRTIDEISLILNYSHRQTERLHKKALELFVI